MNYEMELVMDSATEIWDGLMYLFDFPQLQIASSNKTISLIDWGEGGYCSSKRTRFDVRRFTEPYDPFQGIFFIIWMYS